MDIIAVSFVRFADQIVSIRKILAEEKTSDRKSFSIAKIEIVRGGKF